jgi:hypothetical protein
MFLGLCSEMMLSSCRPKERREMCIFADFREDSKVHLFVWFACLGGCCYV